MSTKKQSPLQELMQWIDEQYPSTVTGPICKIYAKADSLLPKEQQLLEECFDAGEKYGYAEGVTETDPHPLKNPYPNKETFLNKYKPEP